MEYTYIPKQCKGENPTFDGKVKLKDLGFDAVMDLLEVMQEVGADENESAKLSDEEKKAKNLKALQSLRKLVNDTKQQWLGCELTHKETGTKLSSIDDCYSFNPAFGVLVDVAKHLVDSSSLGSRGTGNPPANRNHVGKGTTRKPK